MKKSADDNMKKYPARKDGGGGSLCRFDFIFINYPVSCENEIIWYTFHVLNEIHDHIIITTITTFTPCK